LVIVYLTLYHSATIFTKASSVELAAVITEAESEIRATEVGA
jgi:hypothetical protein